jgi:RHS repeat-associated protein
MLFAAAGIGIALVTRRVSPGLATTTSGAALLLLCAQSGGTPHFAWVHIDPLGTPLAVTSSPATYAPAEAIWQASYEPFGKATVDEDPDGDSITLALSIRFPGQYEDVETGWHYNMARHFDPTTGRYLESDPIALAGGWNLYEYATSDPINSIDPAGLKPEDMRFVWHQALGQFLDLDPMGTPVCGPVDPDAGGSTSVLTGTMTIPQYFCDKPCLTEDDWTKLFFTLLHESMHSTDSIFRRYADFAENSWKAFAGRQDPNSANETSIHNREAWERFRAGLRPPTPIWGIPRATPVDARSLYDDYRRRTPACQCETPE